MRSMPLCLTEGMAEYYAKDGIDPESEMLALHIIVNNDVMRGYGLLDFFDDRPGSVLWTYKLGQVRCAFLEATYGLGTLQRILEAAPLLAGNFLSRARVSDFPEFLHAVVGDSPEKISEKFQT